MTIHGHVAFLRGHGTDDTTHPASHLGEILGGAFLTVTLQGIDDHEEAILGATLQGIKGCGEAILGATLQGIKDHRAIVLRCDQVRGAQERGTRKKAMPTAVA